MSPLPDFRLVSVPALAESLVTARLQLAVARGALRHIADATPDDLTRDYARAIWCQTDPERQTAGAQAGPPAAALGLPEGDA